MTIADAIRNLIEAQTIHQKLVDSFEGNDFSTFHQQEIESLRRAEQQLECLINEIVDTRIRKVLQIYKHN